MPAEYFKLALSFITSNVNAARVSRTVTNHKSGAGIGVWSNPYYNFNETKISESHLLNISSVNTGFAELDQVMRQILAVVEWSSYKRKYFLHILLLLVSLSSFNLVHPSTFNLI